MAQPQHPYGLQCQHHWAENRLVLLMPVLTLQSHHPNGGRGSVTRTLLSCLLETTCQRDPSRCQPLSTVMTSFKTVLTCLVRMAVNKLLHPNLQEINVASVHLLVTPLSQVSQTLLCGLAVPHQSLATVSSSG